MGPTTNPGTIDYKVATDGGPNDPMPATWADITTAPNGGPADGIYTATDEYMLAAFNLGGRDVSRNNTQPGFYWVDNVSLTAIPEPTALVMVSLGGLVLASLRRRS